MVDLVKRAKSVGVILEKKSIPKPPTARVGFAVDVSGSALWLFKRGIIQDTLERLLAIAMNFDDNGEMDLWIFDNRHYELPEVSQENYEGYTKRFIMNGDESKWGSTDYAPVMNSMVKKYFGAKGFFQKILEFLGLRKDSSDVPEYGMPAICFFLTDGQCWDPVEAEAVLNNCRNKPIYWVMVGIGNPDEFQYIKRFANKFKHVGFLNIENDSIADISDGELYEQLLTDELIEWAKKFA